MTIRPTRAAADPRCTRRWRITALACLGIAALPVGAGATGTAQADAVAYLVNVTVRPGYHFAHADAALAYGRSLCDALANGVGYPQLVSTIERDFATTDEYQATYLLGQAANELCPAQIWRLRRSAADSHIQ
ncbi:DUF732 domain-containing protein [Mycobacterium sp. 236(2023)]|uniref:DUF732 domain-containing protein n=1 Tax=Mycobacterium sp. 236(2023) TaxID=3038163 RepID=UPI002415765E|nr:DUF732 domain-containing protein [Mycobacterium sp. 236(2023)]MDG4668140.1 DUF732 domain-containing protein [Mycobacterium sp. 236(2023)]